MKKFILIICLFPSIGLIAQTDEFGFRHLQTIYEGDTVDILIKSKKGEEQVKKPLFLFCQGSQPVPLLIRYNKNGKNAIYNVFPFTNPDSLATDYHLVIISKPYVPVMVDEKLLNSDMSYSDSTKKYPKKYIERNLLSYYVQRDIEVLKFLRKQSWVKNKLVVAGHSEGSAVAAKIAAEYAGVTELIYSGGNPLGRMMTLVARARINETDSSGLAEPIFQYWENIVSDPENMDSDGDTYKGNYQFSYPPPIDYLKKLTIPVLVTYGTKDYGLVQPADYFRLEMIRLKKKNFTFKSYIGVEHNFFPLKPNGEINYDIDNWNRVADDWRGWLLQQKN